MARGLVLGATLISVFCFILALIYTTVPLWLVLRIESDQQFCWHGEGIFHSRVYYGSYLDKVFMTCEDPDGIGPISTELAYCSSSPVPPLNDEDPDNYAKDMCTATSRAKVTSILSIFTSAVTSAIGVALHFTKLKRKYEYVLVVLATGLSILTIILAAATMGIMFASPLFSMAHNRAMSKDHSDGIPFNGFACSLTTPLRSPFTLFLSAPLHCLFPGPSALAPVLLMIAQVMATVFFFLLSRQIWNTRKRKRAISSAMQQPLLAASPLLQASVMMEDEEHPSNFQADGTVFLADNDVLKELRNARFYSLYGAAARRTGHLTPFRQWLLITFFPFVLFLLHVLCWTGFILLGVQVIAGFKLFVRYPGGSAESLPSVSEMNDNAANWTQVRLIDSLEEVPSSLIEMVHQVLGEKSSELLEWQSEQTLLQGTDMALGGRRKDLILLEDVVNLFNFSPELSMSYFYSNGAAIVAILTGLAMFVLPITKSLFWAWYWFAPADELRRGWILTIVDFSGKWMLAYIFLMAIMGAAMALDIILVFPWFLFPAILPKDAQLLFELEVGLTWSGAGGWCFVIACVSSLVLGQMILYVHQVAVEWEELRREQRDMTLSPGMSSVTISGSGSTGSSGATPPTGSTPLISAESPSMLGADTPAMLSAGPVLRTSQSLHQFQNQRVLIDPHQRPRTVMQAIKSFTNLQELTQSTTGMASTAGAAAMDHDSERLKRDALEARRPILTAIARYGSRALLHEDVENDEDEEATTSATQGEESGTAAQKPISKKNAFSTSALRQLAGPPNPRVKLSRAIHPEVEAMCDRVHQPLQGVRLRWTPRGKAIIWFHLFLLAAMFILSQLIKVFQLEQTGVLMFFMGKNEDLNIVDVADKVLNGAWGGPKPYAAAGLVLVTLSFMPLLRLLFVAYLWVLPLTVNQQKAVFSFLEFSEAWSSLEVFLATLVGILVELPQITKSLTGAMTPKISELILFIFPFFEGFAASRMHLLPGFWFVLIAVLLEKIISRLIMQQAATAIAERQAEKMLRTLARGANATGGNLERIDENLSWDGQGSRRREVTGMIGDATEGLLETDAAYFFSPAGRYTLPPQTFYGGLPRSWWTSIFQRWGLMGDAELVHNYGSPSSFTPATMTPSQHEGPLNDGFRLESGDHPHSILSIRREVIEEEDEDGHTHTGDSPPMF